MKDSKLKTCVYVLILSGLLLSQSCSSIGDAPRFPDPEYEGEWVGDGVNLLISHSDGSLVAVGISFGASSVWDTLSYTGNLNGSGVANGTIQLWGDGAQGSTLVAQFEQRMSRQNDTITLDLAPLQETYVLRKQ